jgi:hypothetical protein
MRKTKIIEFCDKKCPKLLYSDNQEKDQLVTLEERAHGANKMFMQLRGDV